MSNSSTARVNARNLGAALIVLALAGVLVFLYGKKAGWWEERYLLLASVGDARELEIGSQVWYRGVPIGEVTDIRPPEEGSPGFKLRMAVDKAAFRHIATDALVRVDEANLKDQWRVTVLPGLDKPDWDFPGQVKVLREAGDADELLRMIQDMLDGLVELSRAKASEAEVLELKQKIMEMTEELERLRAQGADKKQ